jgi:hypothetical protein
VDVLFVILVDTLIFFGLPTLLWWLWWRVTTRLRASERVGSERWGPFLFVVAFCLLIGAVGAVALAILTPLAEVIVSAILAMATVSVWMLLAHRWSGFALLLVLQATAAYCVAYGALVLLGNLEF